MARTQGSKAVTTGPKVTLAAMELFARHGYAAVSMRQVAKEVGVQAGALYNYFPDKQSLLFTLLNEHMTELIAAWEALPKIDDPSEELKAFVAFHLDYHLARRNVVFLSYMELRNLTEENYIKVEALRKTYEGFLRGILERGKASHAFDIEDPKITSFAIIGMLKEVVTWFNHQGPLGPKAVSALYWELVRKMVHK